MIVVGVAVDAGIAVEVAAAHVVVVSAVAVVVIEPSPAVWAPGAVVALARSVETSGH